ncbi:DUF982 domain-containing protein [Mesorhizobium sp. M2D.F.Ca.ET.232.01.1.1]|uniref:DUF982 domain-containing protein n=1 Tax=unclassified Mesorhizobium TaxID=325217 RepID=UPI0026C8A8EE
MRVCIAVIADESPSEEARKAFLAAAKEEKMLRVNGSGYDSWPFCLPIQPRPITLASQTLGGNYGI